MDGMRVVPLVGTWIEIENTAEEVHLPLSRAPRGHVD